MSEAVSGETCYWPLKLVDEPCEAAAHATVHGRPLCFAHIQTALWRALRKRAGQTTGQNAAVLAAALAENLWPKADIEEWLT